MYVIQSTGLSMNSAEELVARVWRALEEHDIAAPGLAVEADGDGLTIGFTFGTKQAAGLAARAVRGLAQVVHPSPPGQARRWHSQAEEHRAVADQMNNPSAQDSFRRMARTYDRPVEQLEARAAGMAMPKKPEAG